MYANKKRANKRQREVMLERLHANIEIVRGNQADSLAIDLWANLASELNVLGCSRTVKEWQHVWNVWVSKTKTKARKIKQSQHATGGGPGIDADLDDTESKILEVVGSASVFGHDMVELGIQTSTEQTITALDVPSTSSAGIVWNSSSEALDEASSAFNDEFSEIPIIKAPINPNQPAPSQPKPTTSQSTPVQPSPSRSSGLRRRFGRQPRSCRGRSRRPTTTDALVMALNENGQAWRETVLQAAHVIAAAIRSLNTQPPTTSSPNPQPQ